MEADDGGARSQRKLQQISAVKDGSTVNENIASGDYSTVSGGWRNRATDLRTTVGGGGPNLAGTPAASGAKLADCASVGGGCENTASAPGAIVSGGQANGATGVLSLVSGGYNNSATGQLSSISSGRHNSASGPFSVIAGGHGNRATEVDATIGGACVAGTCWYPEERG